MKRIIYLMCLFSIILCGCENDNEEMELSNIEYVNIENANVGDRILFGKYEQDGNVTNGKEDIEWLVLERNDKSKCILVISDKALVYLPYKSDVWNYPHDWNTSGPRTFLNDNFYNSAFDENEKQKLTIKKIFFSDSGYKFEERLFLLSIEEIEKYLNTNESRICFSTKCCSPMQKYGKRTKKSSTKISEHLETINLVNENCRWWLRDGSVINKDGSI